MKVLESKQTWHEVVVFPAHASFLVHVAWERDYMYLVIVSYPDLPQPQFLGVVTGCLVVFQLALVPGSTAQHFSFSCAGACNKASVEPGTEASFQAETSKDHFYHRTSSQR